MHVYSVHVYSVRVYRVHVYSVSSSDLRGNNHHYKYAHTQTYLQKQPMYLVDDHFLVGLVAGEGEEGARSLALHERAR